MAATGKGAFRRLNHKLLNAAPSVFRRLTLSLIRFLAPYRLATQTLGECDLLDGDLIVWNGDDGAELVVQCVWFDGSRHDLWQEKVQECVQSVETFAKSGSRAKVFVVVHNRPGKSEASPEGRAFRVQVGQ